MEEYNAVLAYFDRKGSTHFTKPNQRDLRAILSTTQTTEERERDLRRISQLPEMQQPHKTQSIVEEDENDVTDNFDERSTTRASGSTGLKRKISEDMTDKNKKHPGANTVIYMYNPTISTQILGASSSSTSPRTPPAKDGTTTVQSTPRAT
eukprot:6460858-Amphidinium_carterae.1